MLLLVFNLFVLFFGAFMRWTAGQTPPHGYRSIWGRAEGMRMARAIGVILMAGAALLAPLTWSTLH